MCSEDRSTNRSKVTFESHNSSTPFSPRVFIFFFLWRFDWAFPLRGFAITLMRYATLGRTPLDEWPARRRDFFLTIHNTHKRQTSVYPVEFECTIPASERPQTHAFERATTGIGACLYSPKKKGIIICFRKWALLLLPTTHRKWIPFIVIDYVTFRGACAV